MKPATRWLIPALFTTTLLALPMAANADPGDKDKDRSRHESRDHHHKDRYHNDHRRGYDRHSDYRYESRSGVFVAGRIGSVTIGARIVDPGPIACAPQPVHRIWVPGHYEIRQTQVLVERGHYVERYVPAVYRTEYRHGCRVTVLARPAHIERCWVPDRYECHDTQVWVEGYLKDIHHGYGR